MVGCDNIIDQRMHNIDENGANDTTDGEIDGITSESKSVWN